MEIRAKGCVPAIPLSDAINPHIDMWQKMSHSDMDDIYDVWDGVQVINIDDISQAVEECLQ